MKYSGRQIHRWSNIKEEGFTLIEVLISLALVGLLVSVLLPIEGSSFSGIMKIGAARKELYEAQAAMEKGIAGVNDGVEIVTSEAPNLTIQIPGEKDPLNIPGVYITPRVESSKPITAFVADKDD